MTAPVMFSFTYAFMPWMIATTVMRNPTETMIPRSVKNERSFALRMDCTARRTADHKGMGEI